MAMIKQDVICLAYFTHIIPRMVAVEPRCWFRMVLPKETRFCGEGLGQ